MEEAIIYKTEKRIDTRTAPKLSEDLTALANDGHYNVIIDMSETVYISSVGLRALLAMQKAVMAHEGSMIIRCAGASIREIFDVTGFSGFLSLEE